MSKFRSKPFVVEAVQWFKNGDHPKDNCRTIVPVPGDGDPFMGEGEIVRRFAHPEIADNSPCEHCRKPMREHGWIDTVQGGHTVCPGDWIITEPNGTGFYPCKPDVFAAKYEPSP